MTFSCHRRAWLRASFFLLIPSFAPAAEPPAGAPASVPSPTSSPTSPPRDAAAPLDVSDVLRALAQNTAGKARFTETRTSSVLDRPLVSNGELSFEAPSRFVKRTSKPVPETLSVEGSTVRIERAGKTHVLDIDAYPDALALVDALRGTLLGDRRALDRAFAVSASGTAARWTLALLPNDPRIAKTISHVRISGAQREVLGVDVLYADGDRSSMRIEPR